MIGIQLRGWLGNQMFQYAAARTLSEQLDCPLIIAGQTFSSRYGIIGHRLGLDCRRLDPKIPQHGLQRNGVLNHAFACAPSFAQTRIVELFTPVLRRFLMPLSFTPRTMGLKEGGYELFDETVFSQRAGTWLQGWFQSEKYFAQKSTEVREWFRPRLMHQSRMDALMSTWPRPPEQMVAIHLRRGDYARISDNLSSENDGWLLPIGYYRNALGRVPDKVSLAIFSDEPQWAAEQFRECQPWVSAGESPVVDMMLMARCRWNIIANSTFSWWAAWLNGNPQKVVMAPRYHLGWRIRRWVPDAIQVNGWQYLDVVA